MIHGVPDEWGSGTPYVLLNGRIHGLGDSMLRPGGTSAHSPPIHRWEHE